METFVIYKTHYNNERGWIRNIRETPPSAVIEDFQKTMKDLGRPTGITWKLFKGDLIGAMIETKNI